MDIDMDELDGWINGYKEWVNLIDESWWIDGWIWWMETDNGLTDESYLLKG